MAELDREMESVMGDPKRPVVMHPTLSKAREDALMLALDATGAGAWTWDVIRNTSNGGARYLAMYGFKPNEPASFDAWIARVHPNDRDRTQQQIGKLLQLGATNAWHAQFRV